MVSVARGQATSSSLHTPPPLYLVPCVCVCAHVCDLADIHTQTDKQQTTFRSQHGWAIRLFFHRQDTNTHTHTHTLTTVTRSSVVERRSLTGEPFHMGK